MIKHLVYSLLAILICSTAVCAKTNISANPVSLGMLLVEQPSLDKMISSCKYYNLVEESSEDGFIVFRHPDGTMYQFKVEENSSRYSPVVKISTKESQKTIDNILTQAGYKKEHNVYVKGSKFEHRRTKCSVSGKTHKVLTFEKEYNSVE